jgi:transcriptional regulator with XRE-family HTH domain
MNGCASPCRYAVAVAWRVLRSALEAQTLGSICQAHQIPRYIPDWIQEEFLGPDAMQRSYLVDLELGRRNPSVRTLVRVANAFGIAVQDLFEGEVKKRPS